MLKFISFPKNGNHVVTMGRPRVPTPTTVNVVIYVRTVFHGFALLLGDGGNDGAATVAAADAGVAVNAVGGSGKP